MKSPATGEKDRIQQGDRSEFRPDFRPDFRHVRNWIFDLDNTLYSAGNGIFTQIESRMTDYLAAFLKLPRDAARVRQKDLYRQYGTTLNGLMREHACDAEDYLSFVHDIDLGDLGPDAGLGDAIAALPGQRFIFTNGCRNHAQRILGRLDMAHLFDAVWDIRTIAFTPKPQGAAYDSVIAAGGVNPAACAMFDDIARNLVPARTRGMTTVWLKTDAPWGKHGPLMDVKDGDLDHQTEDLTQFLQSIRI
jgi:putative hydrolase of the HAD superfamily